MAREDAGRDPRDRIESAEEHHPENEGYAGDLCRDRLNAIQQHPNARGDEGREDELAEVDEDPLVRLISDALIEGALLVRMDDREHHPEQRGSKHNQMPRTQKHRLVAGATS
jgi:hypothetical protein